MRRFRAWLLAGALSLVGTHAFASLKLELHTDGLDAPQQQASQTLLDEAMHALPPSFVDALDRTVEVSWSSDMPQNAYGQAAGPYQLYLNSHLLASLTDGSAATAQTGRPHGTVRQELLATVLHELTHVYDRARLWSPSERAAIFRCTSRSSSLGKVGQLKIGRAHV